MSKYIITNCPTLMGNRLCYGKTIKQCADCTDCVMKQILHVCSEYSDKWEDCDFSNGLSDEIFKLLDIQEVE